MSRGLLLPLFWLVGLTFGTLGTGFLFQAVTRGSSFDLLGGLALFLPGLYLSGTVLAHARKAHRQSHPTPQRP